MREIAALDEGADQVVHLSFRKPSKARLSGIHNPDALSIARTRLTACLVVMDSGRAAARRPGMTTLLQPVPALDRRVADRGALFVEREERRVADAAPQRDAIARER